MKKVHKRTSSYASHGAKSFFRSALLFLALGSGNLFAQTFTETMGSVGATTQIAVHEAANGFDNDAFTMTGNADVRNTSASNGYPGASGLANVFFTNNTTNPAGNRSFQIEGINSSNIADPVLSFGILKSTIASNASDFIVEVSTDGVTYSAVSFPLLPTGSGTAIWHYRTVTSSIPQAANLRIRFTNTSATNQIRIDDVNLTCSATITPSGPTTLCNGGSVDLTASNAQGGSYLWSNGATTQTITVTTSGTFTVQVTDGSGCVSTSGPVRVLVYPTPMVQASATDSSICEGDSTTLNARTLAQDLIFSEYVEGSGNEKYIEIYNGTGAAVNLGDYEYRAFHNGISTPSFVTALSGTLADGATLVLKNGSAVLFPGGQAAFGVQHNGDDALGLFKVSTATYVDIFGVIGQDPGTSWTGPGGYSTADFTLRRRTDVYSGITVNPGLAGPGGFTTLTTEWDLFAINDVSGLGAHSIDGSYNWQPGNFSGSSVTVAPSSTTTYTVTGTYINGCTGSDDVTITVNPEPVVTISGDNSVCQGACATLTASGADTYVWSTGETTASITVCPNATTSYTVTGTSAAGCSGPQSTASTTVTVNEAAAVVIEADRETITDCYGPQCATLTAEAVHGTGPFTFAWSTGATTQSITVCPNVTTTYTVTMTDANGCTATDEITITVIDACCGHNNNKVLVCLHGHQFCVPPQVVPIFLVFGGTIGECPDNCGDRQAAPIEIEDENLLVVYPSPFASVADIRMHVIIDGPVHLEVKDINGRTVEVLQDGDMTVGTYQFNWTPVNTVAPGVYFLDMTIGGEHIVTKLVYSGN